MATNSIMKAYHTTKQSNLQSILEHGLLPNQPSNFTQDDWFDEIYKCRPIFVSLEPYKRCEGEIVLEVDITNLKLLPDLGELREKFSNLKYASIEYDRFSFGEPIANFDDDWYSWDEVFNNEKLCHQLIAYTGTAAIILQDGNRISPIK